MTYPFFFSYSRKDLEQVDDQNRSYLLSFFDKLCGEVSGLAAVGDGFKDDKDIVAGEEWRSELVDALTTSPILVCMYSPWYFKSNYCGKEVEVFLQRRRLFMQQRANKEPGFVVPVLWQPCLDRIPNSLPSLQWHGLDGNRFSPDDFGVYRAMTRAKTEYKDEYQDLVTKLAIRIRNLLRERHSLPSLGYKPQIDGMSNAFDPPRLPLPPLDEPQRGGPTSVTFVYPSHPRPDAWPFAPPAREAAIAQAAAIAKGKDLRLLGIEFDPKDGSFLEHVDNALQWRSVVVLMLSGAALGDASLKAAMRKLDDKIDVAGPSALATMVIWNDDPPSCDFSDIFPRNIRSEFFYGAIGSRADLEDAMRKSLGGLQNRLALQGPPGQNPIPTPTSHEKRPGF